LHHVSRDVHNRNVHTFDETEMIASRTVQRAGGSVEVSIGRPRPLDAQDWGCPYRIDGLLGGPFEGWAGGVDSVQALLLALVQIGDRLAKERATMPGMPRAGAGFPVTDFDDATGNLSFVLTQPMRESPVDDDGSS
jgi:hypothetical protein